jgi:hypothetical protein
MRLGWRWSLRIDPEVGRFRPTALAQRQSGDEGGNAYGKVCGILKGPGRVPRLVRKIEVVGGWFHALIIVLPGTWME